MGAASDRRAAERVLHSLRMSMETAATGENPGSQRSVVMHRSLAAPPNGAMHLWSRTYIPTSKDAPADAEAVSHKLLVRAGCIRRVGAGIYIYLPLAWRVLQKIGTIVREEMNAAGAVEMLMPALEPIELFAETKRDIDYGDNLFRVLDRHGRTAALAPTHEEIITDLLKCGVSSYRQLPLNLYQIQTKFRDEFRPRSGLLRGREFIMKDAYSFHLTQVGPGGLDEGYEAMRQAYINIFTRCGLSFTVVEAEAGPIGGSASHEFMVNCEAGEDVILRCPVSGYAANVEKCEIGERAWSFDGAPTGALEHVHTPKMESIEAVGKFLKVKPANMLKTIVFRVAGDGRDDSTGETPVWILAVVRGDHEVNPGKVKEAVGRPAALAGEKEAKDAGFEIGFVSPRALLGRKDCLLIVDPDAAQGMEIPIAAPPVHGSAPDSSTTGGTPIPPDSTSFAQPAKSKFWASGADVPDHHFKHFNWLREMGDVLKNSDYVKVADIRNARAGDPSPRAGAIVGDVGAPDYDGRDARPTTLQAGARATLEEGRGIEVGHIFRLGTKYSEAMGLTVLDPKQQRIPVIMGCYGIGVSRMMQACVEMSHDDEGIIWPVAIAPYSIIITPLKVDPSSEVMRTAEQLAGDLVIAGIDVLVDDRDERPGVKFKDADLIGIPLRLTIGEKALAEGSVEFKRRVDPGKGELVKLDRVIEVCLDAMA